MRVRFLFVALLLLAFARPGAASSAHLAWTACSADGGVENVTFPCDQPGTPVTLYASFELTQPVQIVDVNFRLNFLVDATTMPDFWDFQTPLTTGGCNPGITLVTDPQSACPNAIAPFPGGNQVLSYVVIPPSTPQEPPEGRIVGTIYQDLTTAVHLAAGQTYFAFALQFYPDAAVESGGSCAGCATPVNFLQPQQGTGLDRSNVTLDLKGGGTVSIDFDHTCVTSDLGFGQCAPTPARASTWGLLKELYR